MKNSSPLKYYTRNKKRLLLLVSPVLLCTAAVFIIQSLISSYLNLQYKAFVETRRAYSAIQARGNPVSPGVLKAVEGNENTLKVVPCVQDYTEIAAMLDMVGVRIFHLYHDDIVELMARMDVQLAQGRLPEPGANEIVLHRAIAANKGLFVGDEIGNELDNKERLLGRYRIVGLIDGPALCGFASLESWRARVDIDRPEEYGVLIYSKPGRLEELNRFLQYLPMTGNELSSFSTSTASQAEAEGKISAILNLIYIALLAIIALCVGFLSYLFTITRAREFAILNIIGYTRRRILSSNLAAIAVINLAAALLSVLISMGICAALNASAFNAIGIPLPLVDGRTLLLCASVPLLSVIAETLAITRAFGSMDAISLLDSEN